MVLENLDRTQWSFAEALAHVETVVTAHRAVEASRLPYQPPREPLRRGSGPWTRRRHGKRRRVSNSWSRYGTATFMRRAAIPRSGRMPGSAQEAGSASIPGYHTSIRPEQWREARYLDGKLTAMLWEFIDIRVPRFVVLAIWPAYVPPAMPRSVDASPTPRRIWL